MAAKGGRLSALIAANLRASPVKSAVLGLGCVVLIVLLARLVVSGPKEASADETITLVPDATATATSVVAGAQAGEKVQPIVRERLPQPRVRQTLARDPFAFDWLGALGTITREAEEEETESEDALTLQLILTSDRLGGNRMAVISGTMVYPGSRIGGYEVRDISRYHVTLRDRTGEIQLRLP